MAYNPMIDLVAGFSPEEKLANQQSRTNELIQQQNNNIKIQAEELKRRNKILEKQLEEKRRESKKNMWFNILTNVIAFASLIVSIIALSS